MSQIPPTIRDVDPPSISTLGELRKSGYRPRSVKAELRENTLARLAAGEPLFPGIMGYEQTVTPQIVSGLLSKHDLLLLGLRGQAKTRILRSLTGLLDEWTPVIGSDGEGPEVELPDDPMAPTTRAGRAIVERLGERTPVRWMHRSERYHEKLATPDVTIADLIGEVDLVKHAEGRRLADMETMHFGLIPRSNRGIFAINELPDLAPRIQVGLFNLLEERDVQIRGYPVRLALDVCVVFSANPEDYTNRGRIVTPLKDRIGTVVRTHYPADNRMAMEITRANAFLKRRTESDSASSPVVDVPEVMHEIIEETIAQARRSPHVNQASGVSVRASIAALETLVSAAERRAAVTGEKRAMARVCDASGVTAALRGKIELMLAEEGAGADGRSTEDRLIEAFFGEAVKEVVGRHIDLDDVEPLAESFGTGLKLDLGDDLSAKDAVAGMEHVKGLLEHARALAERAGLNAGDEQALACAGELVLEFLYVNNRLSKVMRRGGGPAYTR
ncbi:MAG: magnesium chelatase [Phycisphaeraceae bacterium]|nr:MAG: magnesium chelatase [Phycisphaeraceae bacterium]